MGIALLNPSYALIGNAGWRRISIVDKAKDIFRRNARWLLRPTRAARILCNFYRMNFKVNF